MVRVHYLPPFSAVACPRDGFFVPAWKGSHAIRAGPWISSSHCAPFRSKFEREGMNASSSSFPGGCSPRFGKQSFCSQGGRHSHGGPSIFSRFPSDVIDDNGVYADAVRDCFAQVVLESPGDQPPADGMTFQSLSFFQVCFQRSFGGLF